MAQDCQRSGLVPLAGLRAHVDAYGQTGLLHIVKSLDHTGSALGGFTTAPNSHRRGHGPCAPLLFPYRIMR